MTRWPDEARAWWAMWRDSPLSDDFSAADWVFLADTALIHAAMWSGDLKHAAELRLRVARFGATPEDRQRLRTASATAEEKDVTAAEVPLGA